MLVETHLGSGLLFDVQRTGTTSHVDSQVGSLISVRSTCFLQLRQPAADEAKLLQRTGKAALSPTLCRT